MTVNKDSKVYTLAVAAVLCLVCSVFVAGTAVGLRPVQQAAKAEDKKKSILQTVGLWQRGVDIEAAFKRIDARAVDLQTGAFSDAVDPLAYDMIKATKTAGENLPIPKAADIASVGARPKYAVIYLVRDETGGLQSVILPVSGYGLWSTLYGFLALEADLNTVVGLNFFQHAETPGLGGEVDNPKWKAMWPGKKVFDPSGAVALRLVKSVGGADAQHQVDGLSGATLTSNGVSNAIQFWMSEEGLGPFLANLRRAIDGGSV